MRGNSVCTYTTSGIPAGDTKKVGDVLEVSRLGVGEHTWKLASRIAVAVKTRDGFGDGALRGVARLR